MADNFWGELSDEADKIESPAAILREQASQLWEVSKETLAGQVETSSMGGSWFRTELDLRVPALNDYTVSLITVTHTVALYPADLASSHSDLEKTTCADAAQLREALKTHLASKGVRKILHSLIAQVRG